MGNDWIHTIRGVKPVEGTLPRLARAIEKLAENPKDIEWELTVTHTLSSPGPGWEPWKYTKEDEVVWKRRKQ